MHNNLIKIRNKRNLSLPQVASLINCVPAQMVKLENGGMRINDVWLAKLAKIYDCSIHDLIDDSEHINYKINYAGIIDAHKDFEIIYEHSIINNIRISNIPEQFQHNKLFYLTLNHGKFYTHKAGTKMIFAHITPKQYTLITNNANIIYRSVDDVHKISYLSKFNSQNINHIIIDAILIKTVNCLFI